MSFSKSARVDNNCGDILNLFSPCRTIHTKTVIEFQTVFSLVSESLFRCSVYQSQLLRCVIFHLTLIDSNCPDGDFPKERQASISFRLSRPNSGSKIRTTTPEQATSQNSCTALVPHIPDVHIAASCPAVYKQTPISRSPQTPVNSRVSTDDPSDIRSPSPVKFSLPGIPFASDTSSAGSSPRSGARSVNSAVIKSPSRSPVTSCSPSRGVNRSPLPVSYFQGSPKPDALRAASPNVTRSCSNSRRSPKKTNHLITRSPIVELLEKDVPEDSWESSTLEEMLGKYVIWRTNLLSCLVAIDVHDNVSQGRKNGLPLSRCIWE